MYLQQLYAILSYLYNTMYSTQFKIINQQIQQLKNKSFIQQYKLKDITKQPMIKMQTFTVPI